MTLKNLRHFCKKIQARKCFCPPAASPQRQEMPLSDQRQGGPLRICRIEGDRGLCAKMAAMGLYPGRDAELIHPECGGQCLLKIEDCTLCLDKSTSERIVVTNTPDMAADSR
ncbi:MAG: ferrous iron transport protein A [Desulfobulbaceae bacterium]|jgi:Fe2+ transport system protein FeoA|nr:ferrous iron transport protein A [Desulfobulbaceae bacterium]